MMKIIMGGIYKRGERARLERKRQGRKGVGEGRFEKAKSVVVRKKLYVY